MININKLRQLFKETTRDLSIQIVRLTEESEVAMDGTAYQHSAEIVPDRLECLVTVTQNENLEGGILKDQLWLAGFINKNLNHGFLIRKIVNDPFPLHPKSKMGETVLSSVPKAKINISNDHKAISLRQIDDYVIENPYDTKAQNYMFNYKVLESYNPKYFIQVSGRRGGKYSKLREPIRQKEGER